LIDETETAAPKYEGLVRRSRRCIELSLNTPKTAISNEDFLMPKDENSNMQAESIAISALAFIAGDAELLPRFLAITGIEAASIRQAAREPGFLAGVLDFLLAHEPSLMRFASETGTDPASVAEARRRLPNGDDRFEAST
jgi:hypothetical protein